MTLQRVGVVFDNRLRPETTGLYVRRALHGLVGEVEHLLPEELTSARLGRLEALIVVDDGQIRSLPVSRPPTAWWAIDTHLDFERALQVAQHADLVFAAQHDGAARLRAAGISRARWLPLACDPELHRAPPQPKRWDWCFVGHLFPGARSELLERLVQRFPNSFVGQAYFQEMAQIYGQSRLAFNRSLRNDVNMRVFEALAGGTLLLTNDLAGNGQDELLKPGQHLATYQSAEDLLDQVRFYLAHDETCQRLAAQGQAEVLARHTYRHRVVEILQGLQAVAAAAQVAVPAGQPALEKDPTYFDHVRPEVLALIPDTARCVLDVGCAGGRLGEALKHRQPCEVWGIEGQPTAAEWARRRLDHVLNVDLSSPAWELPTQQFDAIVCADVLEHVRHPEHLLRRLAAALKPHGHLILSLPNLQHHSVITGLLDGHFTYEPAGLLDEDHVRFFTRREIEKLLFRTGFDATAWQAVPGPGWEEWEASGKPSEVRIGGLTISGLAPDDAAAFFTYQYLVRAQVAPAPEFGLTSIVLVTWNQLPYTQQCLASLRFRTDEPYELIVVDNGSTDGTVDYLRAQPGIVLIENRDNRGFPAAVNQGLRVARGRQILLLNNDTLLTTGWLRRMLDALQSDPNIGLVGPVSNSVSGPQEVPVRYRDLSGLDGFAWDRGRQHAGQILELDRLVGFCLLLRREVLEQIGELDERFGLGNYEDDDYCRRARRAGFRTVVALDAFVHHFGHRSFLASSVDLGTLLDENRRKYEEKWQAESSSAAKEPIPSRPSFRAVGSEEGGLELQPLTRVSLCMIVRNNETTIGPCLESIRPWVDEMIVIDTGSTDSTPRICEELGARVRHWAWQDDFSAARNQSLHDATGEWIFWMDSDDTVTPDCGRRLRALVDGEHSPDVLGYVMQVHCPGPGETGRADTTIVDHIKLFRNRPDLRFEHRIHEQILPAIRRAGGEVQFTEIYVVHSGSDHSPEGRVRKLARDYQLLHLDLAERPDHPFVLFNLGMTYADDRKFDEARHWLNRCLEVSRPQESHVRKAYALLLSVLYQQDQFAEAESICIEARRLYPDDKELLFRQAMVHHAQGRLHHAVEAYRDVLKTPTERHFSSVDSELAGIKARHNLALVLTDLGALGEAAQEWSAILRVNPHYGPALAALSPSPVRAGSREQGPMAGYELSTS